MRASILLLCAALTSAQKMCPLPPKEGAAAAAAAPMVTGNPPSAMYSAALPKDGKATGSVTLSTADMGVKIEVVLNLPKEGAPFMYHIHAKPVPAVRLHIFSHRRVRNADSMI
jgi:Cu/Zn superoxide dismutase